MIHTGTIRTRTGSDMQMVDITGDVQARVDASGLSDGIVTIFVPGSTGGVSTIEYEPGLRRDLPEFFDRIAPRGVRYHHDDTWHDGNGHAHLRATLLGPSLTVPFSAGKLTLGTWQQIIFVDFDVPARTRELIVQVMGE
jgi:secondary thiamine-phosphate synthase enzyme